MKIKLFGKAFSAFIVCGVAAALFAVPAWSQDEDEDAAELGTIEVTGSRLPTNLPAAMQLGGRRTPRHQEDRLLALNMLEQTSQVVFQTPEETCTTPFSITVDNHNITTKSSMLLMPTITITLVHLATQVLPMFMVMILALRAIWLIRDVLKNLWVEQEMMEQTVVLPSPTHTDGQVLQVVT